MTDTAASAETTTRGARCETCGGALLLGSCALDGATGAKAVGCAEGVSFAIPASEICSSLEYCG